MSLAVVGIAAVLAVLLVRQGLRADRAAGLLRVRQRALRRQSDAFAKLAAHASLFDPARNEPPRALTETLAQVTGARRASVWRLTHDKRVLRCDDSFDRQTGGHIDGLELHRDEMPRFFEHLVEGDEIEAEDAAADKRTSELHRIVMAPLGSRSLLSVPVWRQGKVAGAVWLEDRSTGTETRDFVRAAANMLALRMSERGSVAPPPRAAAEPAPEPEPRVRSYTAELARRGIDPDSIEGDIYPEVAIMVVHFVDPVSIAVRPPTAAQALSDQIACALQEIGHRNELPYLKVVGQEVTGAAGFGDSNGSGALLIAQASLAIRDHCLSLFEENDRRLEFRIGIDCGPAIGSSIGTNPRVFNLWGEAVRTAGAMATTALPGTVQVTEAAYEKLRHDFLFRPRGSFYLPRIGQARTFVLAGRL
jgi:class 3 adenylate cyclase